MTEYLWKVLFNLRYPPKRVKVKRELKDMYIMADKQLHEAVKAKPNNEKSIAAISSYCCYFYTEEAANEFYQSRQKQNESRKASNVSAVEKENQQLREKLLTVIDFALEECCDNLCSGYVDADDNIKVDKCRFHKLFNGTPGCELERMKKELEEKEQ